MFSVQLCNGSFIISFITQEEQYLSPEGIGLVMVADVLAIPVNAPLMQKYILNTLFVIFELLILLCQIEWGFCLFLCLENHLIRP